MQCAKCGKSDKVTVGNRQYCANCGAVFGDATPTDASAAATATPVTVSGQATTPTTPTNRLPQLTDIARRPVATQPPTTPTSQPASSTAKPQRPSVFGRLFKKSSPPTPTASIPPVPTAPSPVAAPVTPAPIAAVTSPVPVVASPPVAEVNPAKAFHSTPSSTKPAVLDLRPLTAKATSKPAAPVAVTPLEASATPTISAVTKIVPSAPAQPPSTNSIAQTKSLTDRLTTAAATPKSQLINKFGSATNSSPTASVTAAAATAATSAPVEESSSLPQRPRLETPTTVSATTASNPELTDNNQSSVGAAVSNVESLQALMPRTPEKSLPAPASPALLGIKPTSVAAAAIAIAIMGGYIWVKNYPNYALKVASDQAGFEASLPNYLPGNYSLSGPIAAAAGKIALNFSSASDGPLTLQQTKTNWDSGSLLENYVTRKTDKYLAVQNHGLTIYLYNGNQATWINHGIWYTLEGSTHLGRDQVFKIINSL